MDSLNDLIMMAASLLDGRFDIGQFLEWKKMAVVTLAGLLGPFHYYTLNFKRMAEASRIGVLAGEGMLMAAKEQLSSKTGKDKIPEVSS